MRKIQSKITGIVHYAEVGYDGEPWFYCNRNREGDAPEVPLEAVSCKDCLKKDLQAFRLSYGALEGGPA